MPETDRTLTQEMVRDDIDCAVPRCPFCGSNEIEAGRLDAEADSAWGPVTCTACEQEWQDVSFLGAIDLTADDGRVTTIMPEREG